MAKVWGVIAAAHRFGALKVIGAEVAFLASIVGAMWAAVEGLSRLGPLEFVILLAFLLASIGYVYGFLTMYSTLLTVPGQRPVVQRGHESIMIHFPVGALAVPAISTILLGLGALGAWIVDPYPFVAAHRVWFLKVAGFVVLWIGIYHMAAKRTVWLARGVARQRRKYGFSDRITRIDGYQSIVVGGLSLASAVVGGEGATWGSTFNRTMKVVRPDPIQLSLAVLNNPYDPILPEEIAEVCDTDVSVR